MDTVATQRLIDATATLDAADRALLNIWVNQGVDHERLADLSGVDAETLALRKGRLVGRLAEELGDPTSAVRAALETIAATSREANARSDGAVAMVGPAAAPSAVEYDDRPGHSSTGTAQPASDRGRRRRGGVIAALAALLLAAVVAGGVAVSSANDSGQPVVSHPTPAAAPQTATVSTAPPAAKAPPVAKAPSVATTASAPSAVPGARRSRRLRHLAGIRTNLDGWIGLSGARSNLKLELSLRVPPVTGRGHYEVWLYNSILNSRTLGVPRIGTHTAGYELPSDASRYRWIDISFQPPGAISHSGESRLRAANPTYVRRAHRTGRNHVRADRARARHRSSRRRDPVRAARARHGSGRRR